jgi:hypothetical protein
MTDPHALRERANKLEKRGYEMLEKATALRDRAAKMTISSAISAAQASEGPWNPIETIPRDRKVLVKTVTSMERVAKVVHNAGVIRGRIHCWRRDKGRTGDLQAVAWKEIK